MEDVSIYREIEMMRAEDGLGTQRYNTKRCEPLNDLDSLKTMFTSQQVLFQSHQGTLRYINQTSADRVESDDIRVTLTDVIEHFLIPR